MRHAVVLSLTLACACTSGSGFAGDYEAVAQLRQQGGCNDVQSVEPISPSDQWFRLGDVDDLVGYYPCTDLDHCDEFYDLTRSFGRAKNDPDGWAGYLSTALPSTSCTLTYRVRRLTAIGHGVAIDVQVFRDSDPSLSGAACNDSVARERGEGMPCIEASRLVAEKR